ncbi:MAG: ABC transporter substrate-binding protein [Deltaproteobacteria bacterium]|nr:ABC transporter substrate-binding protein [Deltaproteobacteria bacterium]
MSNHIRYLFRLTKAIGLSLALAFTSGVLAVRAQALPVDAQSNVQGFYDVLLSTMKNGRVLGQSERYARLAPVVAQVFDVPYMTRLAVGPAWASLSPAQQQQLVDAFRHYIAATYADRFDSYSGEQLQVTGEQPYQADVIVKTKIIKADGEDTTLNYLMRQNQGTWQIADVYLDGTISQLAVQRSEFSSILRREGVDGLVMALNQKVDLLSRGVAKS